MEVRSRGCVSLRVIRHIGVPDYHVAAVSSAPAAVSLPQGLSCLLAYMCSAVLPLAGPLASRRVVRFETHSGDHAARRGAVLHLDMLSEQEQSTLNITLSLLIVEKKSNTIYKVVCRLKRGFSSKSVQSARRYVSCTCLPLLCAWCAVTRGIFRCVFAHLCQKVTMEELRGGMLVSGHQVQDAGCMRLFAGGVIMTLLGERARKGGIFSFFFFHMMLPAFAFCLCIHTSDRL